MNAVRLMGWVLVLLSAAGQGAQAQSEAQLTAARVQQLGHYADQLLASDSSLRAHAAGVFRSLGVDFLPALLERLQTVGTARPSHDEVLRILGALRRATGVHHGDADVDLARGVLPLLQRERSRAVLAVAEPLLYVRALEAMDDDRAHLALAQYATLDGGAWEDELRAVRKRIGMRLLPVLLIWRTHEQPALRRYALSQIEALGMQDPATALAITDAHLIARVIRAYVSPPDYAAMPLIVRLTSAERIQVRDAARFAVARYAKNAIWQLRELYQEHSGQPANKAWDAEHTARELYAVLDRTQHEDADTLLARGMALLLRNDFAGMQRVYDLLLTKHPEFEERPKLAPGYAALAEDCLRRDDLAAAMAAYQRALWLDPNSPQARSWRSQAAYATAEWSLSHGVADLAAYDRALALDPKLHAAQHARDVLSGERVRRARERKRLAAAGSLLLFAIMSVLLFLPVRRGETSEAQQQETA